MTMNKKYVHNVTFKAEHTPNTTLSDVLPAATPQRQSEKLRDAWVKLMDAIDAKEREDIGWFERELGYEKRLMETMIKLCNKKLGIVD
jgi:hypothetical protein